MVFTFWVRSYKRLEDKIKKGEEFLPKECKHNSKVIKKILDEMHRVKEGFKDLTEEQLSMMSDIIAYSMRPDVIIPCRAPAMIGPTYLPRTYERTIRSYPENYEITFLNNPEELNPKFQLEIEDKLLNRSYALGGCISAAIRLTPNVKEPIGYNGTLNYAWQVADVIAYLLNPDDITDYNYTQEEINEYYDAIEHEEMTV